MGGAYAGPGSLQGYGLWGVQRLRTMRMCAQHMMSVPGEACAQSAEYSCAFGMGLRKGANGWTLAHLAMAQLAESSVTH